VRPIELPIEVWSITVGEKTYELTFGSEDLRKLAEKLVDRAVVVTGTPRQYAIHVTGMKPQESASATEKVTMEVQGRLERLKISGHLQDDYECWGLTVNGVTYELDFGGLRDLAEMTKDLGGKTVAVSGVLEVIPPRKSVLETWYGSRRERLRYPGRMIIYVTSLTIAKAR
jgi:hypothetical protein